MSGLDTIMNAGNNESEYEGSQGNVSLERALEELFSKKDIQLKTDLSQRQIIALSRGLIFAKKYNCNSMRSLINHVMELSVSKNRQGRGELVSLMQSANNDDEVEGLKKKLLR